MVKHKFTYICALDSEFPVAFEIVFMTGENNL